MVRVAWPRGQNEDFEAVDPHRSFADVAFLVPLADEMSKKHTTQAATAQQATSDQNACEPVIFTVAAAFFLFFTAYVLSLLPLAEQMGKKHTTQALTAQQATSDQNTCEPVILTAAFFLLFTAYVLSLLPLAEQMGKKQATQALTAQQATGDQLTDDLFLVSAALPFATQTSSFRLVQQSIRTHYILLVCF